MLYIFYRGIFSRSFLWGVGGGMSTSNTSCVCAGTIQVDFEPVYK